MKIGKVIGTVVATLKHEGFDGRKLLLVRPEDPHGKRTETPVVAVDTVCAGAGDRVLFVDEGNSARQVLDWKDGCVRAVIVGVIDEIDLKTNPKPQIPNPKTATSNPKSQTPNPKGKKK